MKTKLLFLSLFAATSVFAASPEPTPRSKFDDAMADMITKATQTAGQAKDFLVEQTPDVMRQLLYWKAAESIAWDVAALICLGLAITALKFSIKFFRVVFSQDDDDFILPAVVSFGIAAGFTVAFFSYFSLDWLQIWLAPKVYLIEYARHLVS